MEAGEGSVNRANGKAIEVPVPANVVETRAAEASVNGVASEVPMIIQNHGTIYNKRKNRVQCNYCAKVVSTFFRLKYHLARIRGDVTPCESNPEDVMEAFRKELLDKRKKVNGRDGGEPSRSSSALERDSLSIPNRVKRRRHDTSGLGNGVKTESPPEEDVNGTVRPVNRTIGPRLFPNTSEQKDPLPREIQKFIGSYFYKRVLDFGMSDSPDFQGLMNEITLKYEMPSCRDLKGWILQEKVQEMREYARKIKESWTTTGCSILLDGWTDDRGRKLISFLADCPEGPVYLRSADISSVVNDVNVESLFSLLDRIITEEVGFDNVIQVVVSSTEGWMGAVGNRYQDRHPSLFWTVDASHCIGLILEKIGMMYSISKILDEAKIITRLVYGHPFITVLFQNHCPGHDLIEKFKIKSAMPFMTLYNLELVKQHLKDMFSSPEWRRSTWASTVEGKTAADLVLKDSAFWTGVERILKASIPLVRAIHLIGSADKPQMGYIYETIDQTKETIKTQLRNKKSDYMPFWELIDEVWNGHLHSPLHAAGYYLNPKFFYSSSFCSDEEISSGLSWSLIRLIPDARCQNMIFQQKTKYFQADGAFKEGSITSQLSDIVPAQWWSLFGRDCPELQRFAVRVLSQTCLGASRYGLKRSMAEKLLADGRNCAEQQYMNDLIFVQYNMQLEEHRSGFTNAIIDNEVDPMRDWIVDGTPEFVSRNSRTIRTETIRNQDPVGNGASSSRVKMEPL